MATPQHGWTTREWIARHIQEVALDYDDSPPCVSAIPSLLCQTLVRLHHGHLKQLVVHLHWTTATLSSRAENVAVGCRMSSSGSRLWFALLPHRCYSILTSRNAAAAWNQTSIPRPPQLPAVQDPEGVDPSDIFPPAVASEAVALLQESTT